MKSTCLRLISLLCIILLISPILLLSVYAEQGDAPLPADGVSEVALVTKGEKIQVSINLSKQYISEHKRATVYLFELSPSDSVSDLSRLTPVDTYTVSSRHTYKCQRVEGSFDRIYCSYQLAASDGKGGYLPLGERKYIQNPELLSENDSPLPTPRSLKGLCVTSLSDARSLNISNALLEVDLASLFAEMPSRDTLARDFGGKTYYFSLPSLEALDDKVKTLSDEGIVVYLRLSLSTRPDSLPSYLRPLGFEGAAEGATGFAFNIYEREGAALLAAALELIFERYTAEGAPYGFCGSYILGDRVNLPSLHNSAGNMSADEYAELVCSTLRLADAALRSRLETGRIYLSLANNYSALPAGTGASDTTASAFLTKLYSLSVLGGDFPWCIATSAFALDINDSSIWDDALATGASSQYTSPANINVICHQISQNYLYNSTPRPIIVDRFAVSAADSEAGQAASIAFAYYKAASVGGPLALLYSAQTDSPDSAGAFGLSRSDASGNILTLRRSWTAFCELDSLSDSTIRDLTGNVGGVFEYMYSTLREQVAILPRYTGAVTLGEARGVSLTSLFDFTAGDRHGFSLCGVGYPAAPSLERVGERSSLYLSAAEGGIVKSAPFPARRLAGAESLTLTLASCPEAATLTLRILTPDGASYESTAKIPAGERQLSFDISEFSDTIKKGDVTLSLSASVGSLSISEISAGGSGKAASAIIVIMVVILVLFVIMVALALFNSTYHAFRRRHSRSASLARRED